MMIVVIQRDEATGRFHPAHYRERPFPGPYRPDGPARYQSLGHHTEGFDTEETAQLAANELAEKTGAIRPADGWPVRLMESVGADLLLASKWGQPTRATIS